MIYSVSIINHSDDDVIIGYEKGEIIGITILHTKSGKSY